jgi:putative Holliday junction resolvase
MRYLAIDLGDKRTGLAVGDAVTGIVSPLRVVEVAITERGGEALLEALSATVAEQFSPFAQAELVVGLPLNMDGSEGPRAKVVREFAARLAARLQPARVMHFQDERLSSADADWQMARSGKTHKEKKQIRDALAAATVLSDFLRQSRNGGGES